MPQTHITWSARPLSLAAPPFTRSPALREVAEKTSDMIAVLDAAGRRLYANPAFGRLLPSADFIAGSDSFGHVHPEDRSRVRKLFMRVLAERRGQRHVYRIVDRRGNVRRIESHSHVVAGECGDAPRVLVIAWESGGCAAGGDGHLRLRAA
jgi:PAS domain S-box-containing protein